MSWIVRTSEATDDQTGVEHEFCNVLPSWGPEHKLAPDCWCCPDVDATEDGPQLVTHNPVH